MQGDAFSPRPKRGARLAAKLATATLVSLASLALLGCGPIAIFPGGKLRGEISYWPDVIEEYPMEILSG